MSKERIGGTSERERCLSKEVEAGMDKRGQSEGEMGGHNKDRGREQQRMMDR